MFKKIRIATEMYTTNNAIFVVVKVPATRRCSMSPQCEQHMILALLHVSATCDLSLRHVRTYGGTLTL